MDSNFMIRLKLMFREWLPNGRGRRHAKAPAKGGLGGIFRVFFSQRRHTVLLLLISFIVGLFLTHVYVTLPRVNWLTRVPEPQCKMPNVDLEETLKFIDAHKLLPEGATERIRRGEPAYPTGDEYPGPESCPEALEALKWVDEGGSIPSDGWYTCEPGTKLYHASLALDRYYMQCPPEGKLQLQYGEGVVGEWGMLARPYYAEERLGPSATIIKERFGDDQSAIDDQQDMMLFLLDAISRDWMKASMPYFREAIWAIEERGNHRVFEFGRHHSVGGSTAINVAPMLSGVLHHHQKALPFYYQDYVGVLLRELGYRSIDLHNACEIPKVPHPEFVADDWGVNWPQGLWPEAIFDVPPIGEMTCLSLPGMNFRRVARGLQGGECRNMGEPRRYRDIWGVSGRSATDLMMEYYYDAYKMHDGDKFPMFTMLHFLDTHDHDLTASTRADRLMARTVHDLYDSGTIDDTMVFFCSDHGTHLGEYVLTNQGSDEARLPFLYIAVPNKFLERDPSIALNLAANQKEITAPMDIFETMMHAARWPEREPHERAPWGIPFYGSSLFEPLPLNRTCYEAGIPNEECTCGAKEWEQLFPHHFKFVVDSLVPDWCEIINKDLNLGICRPLIVRKVRSIVRRGLNRSHSQYRMEWEMETNRDDPMVLMVEAIGPGWMSRPSYEMVTVTRVFQVSKFAKWVDPCRDEAMENGVNLHLCECKIS